MLPKLPLRALLLLVFALFVCTSLLIWNSLPTTSNKEYTCPLNAQDTSNFQCPPGVHQLAIIVPFRERANQLFKLVPHLHAFLDRQHVCHQFYVINQVDNYRFNRGMLINAGFHIASNVSTYMAMHDVDLLPLNDQLSYGFPSRGPFHLSAPSLHPKYHYEKYVGGILLIRNEHFIRVNGFSTKYWGWGLEDDEFYTRLKEANLNVYRPHDITTNSSNTFLHLHDQSVHKRDMAKLFNQREVTRKRDRQTGLNTTRFRLVEVHHLTIEGVPIRVFDVTLNCDLESTPWCQRVSSTAKRKTEASQTSH